MLAIILVFGVIPVSAQKKVKLNKKSVTMSIGDGQRLRVKGVNSKVKWSSTDTYVATVNKKGYVKGKHSGSCVVKAKFKYMNKKKTLKAKIRVKSYDTPSYSNERFTSTVSTTASSPRFTSATTSENVSTTQELSTFEQSTEAATTESEETTEETTEEIIADCTLYSYEVIPLLKPFNDYFFIKTDNPDPASFMLSDEDSKYSTELWKGRINVENVIFKDVIYEDESIAKVKGGYIGCGVNTDGGPLKLKQKTIVGKHYEYSYYLEKYKYVNDYKYVDTGITVNVDNVMSSNDYLISTYGDDSKSFFDNLTGIQEGFKSICLYGGVRILGELKKSEAYPYYGLSTSPHVDQGLYIQSPYSRSGGGSLLVSSLYPFRYDSLGFPRTMMNIAVELNPDVEIDWSTYYHDEIEVYYNGEMRSYGGAGKGGNGSIDLEHIKYYFSFDGSSSDLFNNCTMSNLSEYIKEYTALNLGGDPIDESTLTWDKVCDRVGKKGSYVKLILLDSIYGDYSYGYSYLYDNRFEGYEGDWQSVGAFSGVWYDGRYFNRNEYFESGVAFEDSVKDFKPTLVFDGVKLDLPNDGRTYVYDYSLLDDTLYDFDTGMWKQRVYYSYDYKSNTWKCTVDNFLKYVEDGRLKSIDTDEYIDACTITMEEAMAMNIDYNTNKEPDNYYIYDSEHEPGTYH